MVLSNRHGATPLQVDTTPATIRIRATPATARWPAPSM
ncbi:hypothetical protein BN2497_14315 [Janthinobacterium sp. CG23_2]|nr:hypothetical protein BN2497_14315 [Janthinobacterium sp. CG23_2]CUU33555.1 hypothetical protein BN3177_14315 [Janthinobacterium sp. CG23_2]